MYGYTGADLVYGYGSGDYMYGGNESGWGDKMFGGNGAERMSGQDGDDALYGGNGDDTINGGRGDDVIQGDYGNDNLNTGKGADQVNAQDRQRDWITCGNASDVVYYDSGLDVLKGCGSGNGPVEQPPPGDLFKPKTKVLVSHNGEEPCVREIELKSRLEHGDEILNPQGCSNAEEGRN